MSAVAVSGSGGTVGAVLVEHLSRQGHAVVAVDQRDPPASLSACWENTSGGPITPVRADVRNASELTDVLCSHEVDSVVHLAAITAGPDRESTDPETIVEVNVGGTVTMLRAAKACGVRRVIHVSSNAVYGPAALETDLISEDRTIPRPTSLYGVTKFCGEGMALRLSSLWGVDVRIARLSSVFGPWEHPTGVRDTLNPVYQVTLAAVQGRRAVMTRPCRRDWIYNRDVARAIFALLDTDRLHHHVYHVGPGPDMRWAVTDWCRLLAGRFPGFEYGVVEAEELATIDLHEAADRAPMDTARLNTDTDFRPVYDLQRSFDDFMSWLDAYRFFWIENRSG